MKKSVFCLILFSALLALFSGCGEQQSSSLPESQSAAVGTSQAASETSGAEEQDSSSGPAVDDPFAAAAGYRTENAVRYADYAAENPDLTTQQVVSYVNIGLDTPFYSGVETIADPDNLLVLCNKYHQLPDGYEPSDLVQISQTNSNGGKTLYLRAEAAAAFEQLCAGAAADGYTILGQSGYRSYSYQEQLYNNYVARDGQAAADTYSARPGFSEHQTGLAMDICNGTLSYTEFGQTAEYEWAKEHLHEYGFVLHYLPGTEQITGYMTEEWHIRYVGVETATKIHELGITLDEYCATYLE